MSQPESRDSVVGVKSQGLKADIIDISRYGSKRCCDKVPNVLFRN
jgi:hypothetical protein